jgi:hypothetical protein
MPVPHSMQDSTGGSAVYCCTLLRVRARDLVRPAARLWIVCVCPKSASGSGSRLHGGSQAPLSRDPGRWGETAHAAADALRGLRLFDLPAGEP